MDEGYIENDLKVITRPFNQDLDQAFLYATWRNSSFYGSPMRYQIKNQKAFFKEMTAHIKRILKSATVKVACLDQDESVIIGYSVFTGKHLHWVYVKDAGDASESFRKKGIATMLCPKDLESATHHATKVGQIIAQKKSLILKGE